MNFSDIKFITPINCTLRFELANEDYGIDLPELKKEFACRLTIQTYKDMLGYIAAFSKEEGCLEGYSWLYDPKENKVDLLFSPGGFW